MHISSKAEIAEQNNFEFKSDLNWDKRGNILMAEINTPESMIPKASICWKSLEKLVCFPASTKIKPMKAFRRAGLQRKVLKIWAVKNSCKVHTVRVTFVAYALEQSQPQEQLLLFPSDSWLHSTHKTKCSCSGHELGIGSKSNDKTSLLAKIRRHRSK